MAGILIKMSDNENNVLTLKNGKTVQRGPINNPGRTDTIDSDGTNTAVEGAASLPPPSGSESIPVEGMEALMIQF